MGRMGFGLFSIGIIIAVTAGAKAPARIGEWPDTWPVFLVGAVLCIAGLVMWHRGTRAEADAAANDTESRDPVELLNALQAPLNALGNDIDALDADGIMNRVDGLLDGYVLPFGEVRQRIIDSMGMEDGAEVLVVVAYGERILNRVWTAAADGHLPEARACFPEAAAALHEANQKLSPA
jgi:hypothetical protein